jgi:hypothetical protein
LVALLSEVIVVEELVLEVVVEFVSVACAVITKPPMIAAHAVISSKVSAVVFLSIFLRLLFLFDNFLAQSVIKRFFKVETHSLLYQFQLNPKFNNN